MRHFAASFVELSRLDGVCPFPTSSKLRMGAVLQLVEDEMSGKGKRSFSYGLKDELYQGVHSVVLIFHNH